MINSNPTEARKSVTVSYDEKPGIQAIKNIGAQLSLLYMERYTSYKNLMHISIAKKF